MSLLKRKLMSLTPYVIEDTGRGERSMDIFSRLLKDRIICELFLFISRLIILFNGESPN